MLIQTDNYILDVDRIILVDKKSKCIWYRMDDCTEVLSLTPEELEQFNKNITIATTKHN